MKKVVALILIAIFSTGCNLKTGYQTNENEQIYIGE